MPEARFNDISYQRFLVKKSWWAVDADRTAHDMSRRGHCAPKCYSAELEWVGYSRDGLPRLPAFVPPPMQVWGYGRQNPYQGEGESAQTMLAFKPA